MKELILKRCKHCGAIVKVIEEGSGKYICCGEEMEVITPNSVDAAFEKHVPNYERVGENIHITINHVMEEDHYIEWILVKMNKENREVLLNPNDVPEMTVPYEKGAIIYAYCNKHGLWNKVVE